MEVDTRYRWTFSHFSGFMFCSTRSDKDCQFSFLILFRACGVLAPSKWLRFVIFGLLYMEKFFFVARNVNILCSQSRVGIIRFDLPHDLDVHSDKLKFLINEFRWKY